MSTIKDFHIHLYYDSTTLEKAQEIAQKALVNFPNLGLGRFHQKPVGPHPMWSVQLLVSNENFGPVLGWLSLNRKGLIVFVHPNTGNDLLDHTNHAIWLGEKLDLNLSIFN